MKIELISSGTELLCGKVNTNAGYIGSRLYEMGLELSAIIDTSDRKAEFEQELKRALDRSDVIITTGGLGPTFDDITVETAAESLEKALYKDETVLEDIRAFFNKRKIPAFTKNNEKQALIVEGADILRNENGTAPGQMIHFSRNGLKKTLFLLPGPPREMRAMFDRYVGPFIENLNTKIVKNEIIHICGLGESHVEDLIKPALDNAQPENPDVDIEFGILAHNAVIDVKYRISGSDETLIDKAQQKIKTAISDILKNNIFGYGQDTLASSVAALLKDKNACLSGAESCTGGLISKNITDISGASAYFKGSIVSYSNEAKIKTLGVKAETIKEFGAVSAQTAKEMAMGALKLFDADFAFSVTGIAGPDGGSSEKPVGLIHIAIASNKAVKTYEYNFIGNRTEIRERTTNAALNLLRLAIKESDD